MKKNIFSIIFAVIIFLPSIVSAANSNQTAFSDSLKASGAGMGYSVEETGASVYTRIGGYISVILGLLGVIFFLITVYGGYLWMTARGDEAKVKKAKEMISQAAVGLIIIISAYAITAFVGGALSSSNTGTSGGTQTSS